MTVREQIADCFKNCRGFEENYGMKIDDTHSLFILVQESPEYKDGTLEYFIELNDTTSGAAEPCAQYNQTCLMDNLEVFERVVFEYLKDNKIFV